MFHSARKGTRVSFKTRQIGKRHDESGPSSIYFTTIIMHRLESIWRKVMLLPFASMPRLPYGHSMGATDNLWTCRRGGKRWSLKEADGTARVRKTPKAHA